jgi:hypothetical protein
MGVEDKNFFNAATTTAAPATGDYLFGGNAAADTYQKTALAAAFASVLGGSDATALAPAVADNGAISLGKSGAAFGPAYIGRANQKTSSAAPASLTEYPNANDWGIHHDTNADTISLAFNKAGTLQILDLAGGGITGWSAGAGNALVPDVAGTDIGAVGNEAGRIYGNNIIDLTAAGGAAQVLGPGGYSMRLYGGGVSLLSTLNIVSTLGIGTAFGNAKLTSSAADILEQRNSTNAQEYRLYNTYTDASNYERGELVWDTNKLYLRGAAAGTGALRNVQIGSGNNGYINIYEIGDSSGIDFGQGGSGKLTLRSGSLRCQTPGAVTLGEAGFEWGDIYSNGDIYLRPSSSLTPSSNGDLVIEATNDTTLTFKLKGSDGTVRSGTVALS